MQPFFTDYLERLQTLHSDVEQVLAALPPTALDWQPGADMNSVAILVAHIAGSEQFWVSDMTQRGAADRVRAQEFDTHGLDKARLQARLDAALQASRATLAQLTVADLAQTCPLTSNGQAYTVGWALLHALEHVALHVGHLQMIRQMWEAETASHTSP